MFCVADIIEAATAADNQVGCSQAVIGEPNSVEEKSNVDVQQTLSPSGLGREQFRRLTDCADQAASLSHDDLRGMVGKHVELARDVARGQALVNVRLAEALEDSIARVMADWQTLPAIARPWLEGAVLYFVMSADSEPDFSSAIGFEDDAHVWNACLKLARRDDLCVRPEDFDDV